MHQGIKGSTNMPGKIMYALTFLLIVPAILWTWARFTESIITLPAIRSVAGGTALMGAGLLLMLTSMFYLKRIGKGLPMNAYPPSVFVSSGPYRWLHHPIYWGFALFITGWSLYRGSASGLWLVSPIVILCMVALVMGYEQPDLQKRFPGKRYKTLLDIPENDKHRPLLRDRMAALFWVLVLLFAGNGLIIHAAGDRPQPTLDMLQVPDIFGNQATVIPGTLFILAIPFCLQTNALLRHWSIASLIALFCTFLTALLYPQIGTQYLIRGSLVIFSVPPVLALISVRSMFDRSLSFGLTGALAATVVIMIQLSKSGSALAQVAISLSLYFLSYQHRTIWLYLRNLSEKIANSWKEWVFGKIRIINHGFYVGIGAFTGVTLAGTLAGKEYALALLIFSVIVTVCAAVWAQVIEGSEKLKRPYGYYGGLAGILLASMVVWLMGYEVWVILGVVSVVMPWVQAIGRLRCLVNGCCHGGVTQNPDIGIRYTHPRSRVCNISGLCGELLHPTQLYSMLWLALVGILLVTLWIKGASSSFIFGLYLILTSIGRFVEESYRGESQTPIFKSLRLYQWTAIIALIAGIFISVIRNPAPVLHPGLSWETLLAALVTGFFLMFAMGVDFPYSNARFSRLV